MNMDKSAIARHIPHADAMCLLDQVVEWDQGHIRCYSGTHRDRANPLRRDGQLHVLCAVEYAAQAMAVHGALLTGSAGQEHKPKPGYLVSVRDLAWQIDRLDQLPGLLQIDAQRLMGDTQNVVYRFAVSHAGAELATGRATVVLEASAL